MGQFALLSTTEKCVSKHVLKQVPVTVAVVFLQTGIRREPPVHILFDYIDLESSSVSRLNETESLPRLLAEQF